MFGLLLVALIAIPIVEIYVIIQVGSVIGPWWTIFALVAETLLGVWLVRHEGRRTWQTLVEQLNAGKTPTKSVANGAVILLGGVLLLIPGFVTDAIGFLCVIPFTRAPIRAALIAYVSRRSSGLLVMGTPAPASNRGNPVNNGHTVIEGHLAEPPDKG
jgi:UPF0716 protein FxsA